MIKNFTLFIILIFFKLYCFSQDVCEKQKEGIDFYLNNDYNKSIDVFQKMFDGAKKGDECYIKSCLWLAKSYSKIDIKSKEIGKYLSRALLYNDLESLRFYALNLPHSIQKVDLKIRKHDFLVNYNKGEIYFLIGNIYAKSSYVNEDYLFNEYLEKSIENGFNEQILYSDNFIRVANCIRYDSIIDKKVQPNLKVQRQNYIDSKMIFWATRGKFEKSEVYAARVNKETGMLKKQELSKHFMDSISTISFENATNDYDPDNEIFKITFNNSIEIYLSVPINEAMEFDKNFSQLRTSSLDISYSKSSDMFEINYLIIINPLNKKHYIYDNKKKNLKAQYNHI